MLGGFSVIVLSLLTLIQPEAKHLMLTALAASLLANFVNHPHFAHSYQLFYGEWRTALSGMERSLRLRWLLAGIFFPLLLAGWLLLGAVAWRMGMKTPLALSLLLMGILVGWHYVKQGFGMAMMDAAVKKAYWPAPARKALLWNAYACWFAAWAWAAYRGIDGELWGVPYWKVKIAVWWVLPCSVWALITTLWASIQIKRSVEQWRSRGLPLRVMPLPGIVAYVVTLYLWTLFAHLNPFFLLVIPFFHSLQYLTVVWRYKMNEVRIAKHPPRLLLRFLMMGFILGALGFWLVPRGIDFWITGEWPSWSGGLALATACMWIFINVHHYLIDNVLWRQGNPKVKAYLFDAA